MRVFRVRQQELFVTHGAVSHQMRTLEDELGVPLFERRGKRVMLTHAGRAYADRVREALDQIAQATHQLRAGNRDNRLAISTMPSFAARWLTPHIGTFIERHPELEVELFSSPALVDFAREEVDVALRMGSGNYPGLYVEKLLDDVFFPICSPAFNGGRLPRTLAEMASMTLLRSEGEAWKPWFDAAGVEGLCGAARRADVPGFVIAAAGRGSRAGIALIRPTLAFNDLLTGRVVRLFETTIPCPWNYYFVCAAQRAADAQDAGVPHVAAAGDCCVQAQAGGADERQRGLPGARAQGLRPGHQKTSADTAKRPGMTGAFCILPGGAEVRYSTIFTIGWLVSAWYSASSCSRLVARTITVSPR
ncbi:transcriptional regulator GcvA [Cupriavidus basilensis]